MSSYSIIRHFKFNKPLLRAYYFESKYYVIDSHCTLHLLDNECNSQLKMRLSKDKKELHHYAHNYSFSNGVVSIPQENSVMCAKYKDEKLKVTYKKEHASKDIVYSVLNQSASMLLNCSLDGKASILNTVSKFYCFSFENQPDYCSSAFFSTKDIFVYIGYFNMENKILNLKNLNMIEFQLNEVVETGTFFDNDTKLFLADRAGNSIIYDCMNAKTISTKALFNEWVSCVKVYNQKYLFVGTRKNKLYIVDAFENELITTIELASYGVTSMELIDKKLLLSYADSTFELIELNYLQETFILHLNLQEYKEAKNVLEKNLFLYADESVKKFEDGFPKILSSAKELISSGDLEEALEITEPFRTYQKFKNELDLLFSQQDHIAKFIEAVEKKDIRNAYALSEGNKVITTLGSYQTLEKQWEKVFGQAKKVIEKDNLHGKNKASDILEKYLNIPQKSELIKQLLSNGDKFVLADKFVKEQAFDKYFALLKKYTFLKDTLLYKKIDVLASSLSSKAKQALSNNDIEESKKIYTQLLTFPEYSVYAKKNIDEIERKIELENIIESNKLESIYQYVQKYPELAYENAFLEYNTFFEDDLQNAQLKIEKGMLPLAIKILSKYFSIEYLESKVSNLFQHAYLLELKHSNIKEYDVTKTVLGYQKLFGIDDEIKDLFKNKQMEDELKYALKSNAVTQIEKYPETILVI